MFVVNLSFQILFKGVYYFTAIKIELQTVETVAAPEFFFFEGGASRGQNAILRGEKSKNLPKMADFGQIFLLTGGQVGEAEPPTGGANAPSPPLIPPLSRKIPTKRKLTTLFPTQPFSWIRIRVA